MGREEWHKGQQARMIIISEFRANSLDEDNKIRKAMEMSENVTKTDVDKEWNYGLNDRN